MGKFVIFALILFFDFATKYWVAHHLPLIQSYMGYPFGGIGVIDTTLFKFSIVHTTNTGTAWGLFANFQGFLLFFRLLITGGLLGYLFLFSPPKILQIPLTVIAAGAFGNIVDFFLYGHVVDMVYWIFYHYSFPIFNIADSAIFCAVMFLFFFSKKIKLRSHVSSH
jgi:signal peptidase II